MRIRNGNRIQSHEAGTEPQELGDIEVLSFSVIDEEKLKGLSQQMNNDLHISGLRANHDNQPQIPKENSSTNQNTFAEANQSQTMENEEGGREEDLDKVKSNLLADNGVKKPFLNPTMKLKITSSSTDKAITGSAIDRNEETSSQKRIRLICEWLKQSEQEDAAADVGYEYYLRPRRLGKVLKTQSLERINNEKSQKPSSSNANREDNRLIIDMLGDDMKRKLRGSLEKKTAEKKPYRAPIPS